MSSSSAILACASCGFEEPVAEPVGRRPCRFCRRPVTPGAPARERAPLPPVPCLDCGRDALGGPRCAPCAASFVSSGDARLRVAGALAVAAAAWALLFLVGAAVLEAGVEGGNGLAKLLALPSIALLYAADRLHRFRGAPRWSGFIPALPLPVVAAAFVLLRG